MTGKKLLKYFIALMIGAFLIQIPTYICYPEYSDSIDVCFPGLSKIITNSFAGAFFLAVVFGILNMIEKDMKRGD